MTFPPLLLKLKYCFNASIAYTVYIYLDVEVLMLTKTIYCN